MSNIADPSQVKQAITDGAVYSGGKLVVSGVEKFLKLDVSNPDAPFWTLDEANGLLLLNRAHFNRIANNTVITAPGPYQYCFADGSGAAIGQLAVDTVEIDGVDVLRAMVIDPP